MTNRAVSVTVTFIRSHLLAVSLVCLAQAEDYPAEVARLLDQRDRKIAEINKAYRDELEALKLKYTKAGNLDAANQVVSLLEDIRPGGRITTAPESDKPGTGDEGLKKFLEGTTWKFSKDRAITFQRSGTVKKSWGKLEPKWDVKDGSVTFEGKVFVFDKDFTTIEEKTKIEFKSVGKLVVVE